MRRCASTRARNARRRRCRRAKHRRRRTRASPRRACFDRRCGTRNCSCSISTVYSSIDARGGTSPRRRKRRARKRRMLERRRRRRAATSWTPLPTARRKKSERPIRTRWSKMPGLGVITCTTDRTCANSSSGCTRDSRWACGRAPIRGTRRTWSTTCGARTRPRWRSSGDRRGAQISVKIRLERATDLFS